jgi:hypothetical protein
MENAENEVVTVDGGEEELIDRFEFLAAHGHRPKSMATRI